jgi:hypothetical protein
MTIAVPNTRPAEPFVTLFGRLEDGRIVAEVMPETSAPYSAYWKNELEQAIVYIEPNDIQLGRIVKALNDGKLDFSHLQDYGAANGGTSELPV